MANSTVYAGADPTGLASYQTIEEGAATYSMNFTVAADGVAKKVGYYSPAMAGTGTALPNYVGIFEAETITPIVVVNPAVWIGDESSGWIWADIPDTAVVPETIYFAAIGIDGSNMKQAYLYAGVDPEVWLPATSADSNITTSDINHFTTHGPDGPAQAFSNSSGFPYPDSSASANINWLVDVTIEFTPPTLPTIVTTSVADASRRYPYSATIEATDGDTPYSWAVTTGSLPTGLSLNSSTGVISGTPTTNGESDFTITLTDHSSQTATVDLSISVLTLLVGRSSDSDGISTYSVVAGINNTVNAGAQDVRVLEPVTPAAGRPHAFLWVLPVEPGQGTEFGDGIGTMKTLGVHDQYNLTCIQPGFPIDPWYLDNDTDPQTQQDSYVMALVSWAEANLQTSGTEKHFLIGFSKSGFGGQELFWHHQDVFQAVASWDAATDYQTMESYDGADAIGSQDNLTANTLYDPHLDTWKAEGNTGTVKRIFLSAGINLIDATSDYSDRLTADGILHDYVQTTTESHNWSTTPDWVAPAVAAMLGSPVALGAILGTVFI